MNIIKKVSLTNVATLVVAVVLSTSAYAQPIVSVDFNSGANSTSGSMSGSNPYAGGAQNHYDGGVFDVTNWVDVVVPYNDNGSLSPLQGGSPYGGSALPTSTGGTSDIAYSINYSSSASTGSISTGFSTAPFYLTTGNNNAGLMSSAIQDTNNLTLNLSNLDPTHSYSLVAYIGALFYQYQDVTESWTANGQTFYGTVPLEEGTNGVFEQATATTQAGAQIANYVEFDDITGLSNLALTGTGLTPGLFGGITDPAIMGFQLVDNGIPPATPEPSTWALMLSGLGALAFFARRRQLNA